MSYLAHRIDFDAVSGVAAVANFGLTVATAAPCKFGSSAVAQILDLPSVPRSPRKCGSDGRSKSGLTATYRAHLNSLNSLWMEGSPIGHVSPNMEDETKEKEAAIVLQCGLWVPCFLLAAKVLIFSRQWTV